MASVKAKFRLLSASGHEGAVYYQIIHERKIRHVSTPYRLSREEWRACFSMVSQWQREVLSVRIVSICHLISTDVERIKRIAAEMNRRGVHFTADEMVEEYHQYVRRYSLFNFMQSIIMSLRVRERVRTAETYAAALASFRRFRNGEDIVIDAINADIVEDYEAYLKFRGAPQIPHRSICAYCAPCTIGLWRAEPWSSAIHSGMSTPVSGKLPNGPCRCR